VFDLGAGTKVWGWKIQWVAAVLQELWSSYALLMIIYTTQ